MTTDSHAVFRRESIGEGFKIVTVAVFELYNQFSICKAQFMHLILLKKKILFWRFFTDSFKSNLEAKNGK